MKLSQNQIPKDQKNLQLYKLNITKKILKLVKAMTKTASSMATNHKAVIHPEDLTQISTCLLSAPHSPIVLRQCVLYNLSIRLVTRDLEFHHQMRIKSFLFQGTKTMANM